MYQLADVSRGQIPAVNFKYQVVYWLIGNGQLLWMVLWMFLCIGIVGTYYYNRELKKPITMLMDASQKISENNLDFHIEYQRDNELGLLCGSFEEMNLLKNLQRNGEMFCDGPEFVFQENITVEELFLDEQLVLEVYENLLSNAARFAAKQVKVIVLSQNQELWIVTEDDGNGFSQEGLRCAASPFYRGEKQNDKCHFGLGLYICKVLCEQCGGRLIVENGMTGGKVTAIFPQS